MYQIDELPTELFIGKQGESKINDIQIDCAAWLSEYPGSTMSATFIRPGYRDPVVLPVEMDGTTMVVPVRHNVSRYDGVGSLNIQLQGANGEEKRTHAIATHIEKTHPPAAGPMPDMVKDWIELATEKLNEISGHKLLDVSFNGDDLVFTKSNGGTITLAGVKDAFVQELSFNKETSELTISSGNMVSLNRGLTEEQYAHLSEIMARPYGSWVLNTGPVYSQTHPSRDVDGRKSCRVEWGLGIIHLDFVAAAKSGVIGSIPNTPDDPGPKAEILIEVQLRDGSTVWIDENDRTIKGQAMTVGERYLINLIGFFVH